MREAVKTDKGCGLCVRGLLCGQCNKALGLIYDDIKVAQNMVKYLSGKVIYG